MSDPGRLQRFLRTDPRDAGCDEAMAVLHISVDLVAAGQDVAGCCRFADTRNRPATSPSPVPASISPAAAGRTRSRRARSAAVNPPPSGYLMAPAYPPRQPSPEPVTPAFKDR